MTGVLHAARGATLPVAEARAVLGGPLHRCVVEAAVDPDPSVADRLLGLNGCLAVGHRDGRVSVLFAATPSAGDLHAVGARLNERFCWGVAARPDLFAAAFARARAGRGGADGFVERVLAAALAVGASDVKIAPFDLPAVKVDGTTWWRLGEFPPVTAAQAHQAAAWAAQRPLDEASGPFDLDVSVRHGPVRLRANVYRTLRHWGLSLRVLPGSVPPVDTLGLPDPVVGLSALPRGLVFVSGPTGSGKTTTLAALVDRINRTRAVAIATMELPVEYVHRPRKALIHAREVETDTVSFTRAIDSALRQNPDVVLVGELRNTEEYLAAIRLARTGHLVFATLHAESAEEALRGVVHSFPEGAQPLVRTELAATLRAVVVQLLLPPRDPSHPPAVVCEVLLRTPAVTAIVARGAFLQLPGEIRNSRPHGMCSMDDALVEAAAAGRIDTATAVLHAREPSQVAARIGADR